MLALILPAALVGCTLSSDLRLVLTNQNAKTEFYTTEFAPVGNKVPVACENLNGVPTSTQVTIGFNYTGNFKEAHIVLSDPASNNYNSGEVTFAKDSENLGFDKGYYNALFSLNSIKPVPTKYASARAPREVVVGSAAKVGSFNGLVWAYSDTGSRTPDARTNQIDVYENCTLK
ncbi:hypothetical protein GCM10008938_20720 [Deinococcus roseus]|uniref:Lipoprotein n=2 Tax=Deinococcus roseus TaxID=392414 RepID=A0ABQ2CYU7_9DEIO|nr:hypothetical protein GCM10008938_20720 [Deinococcus roseus]